MLKRKSKINMEREYKTLKKRIKSENLINWNQTIVWNDPCKEEKIIPIVQKMFMSTFNEEFFSNFDYVLTSSNIQIIAFAKESEKLLINMELYIVYQNCVYSKGEVCLSRNQFSQIAQKIFPDKLATNGKQFVVFPAKKLVELATEAV